MISLWSTDTTSVTVATLNKQQNGKKNVRETNKVFDSELKAYM